MATNPILDELHAVREKLLAEAGGTLDSLVDRLQAEEEESKRPRYNRTPAPSCDLPESPKVGEVETPPAVK